jgi:hypothetical protein
MTVDEAKTCQGTQPIWRGEEVAASFDQEGDDRSVEVRFGVRIEMGIFESEECLCQGASIVNS